MDKTRESEQPALTADWDRRAKRDGLQSVMSVRWNDRECEDATRLLIKAIWHLLADNIPKLPIKSVTEVGCGIGRVLKMWHTSKYVGSMRGVDLSYNMIERAKELMPQAEFIVADAAFLNKRQIDQLTADFVFTVTCLEHITDEVNFLYAIENIKSMAQRYVLLVEETALHRRHPASYTRTDMMRPIKDYMEVMEPWSLVAVSSVMCMEDKYSLMLFQKAEMGRF